MKKIIVSGIRPTGGIHIGNYIGVIKNWINLQETDKCFFFIADLHALTTNFDKNIKTFKKNTETMLIELIALGINPLKCNIFIQSNITEILEMKTLISMLVNVKRLERVPSYKDDKISFEKTYGFLGYPILQAADVLTFNAEYIPVGEDQLPHIEIIKEVAKKINKSILSNSYFKLNEPKALLSNDSKIKSFDGEKMSKSKNNTILITDTGDVLEKKINKFITDPKRININQPGNPEICLVWSMHKLYNNKSEDIKKLCKKALIGCNNCKKELFYNINKEHNINIKKIENIKKTSNIQDIIKDSENKAKKEAKIILDEIKKNF